MSRALPQAPAQAPGAGDAVSPQPAGPREGERRRQTEHEHQEQHQHLHSEEKPSQKPGPSTETGTSMHGILTQVKSAKTLILNIIVTTFVLAKQLELMS